MDCFLFMFLVCITSLIPARIRSEESRSIEFPAHYFFADKRLMKHTIKTLKVLDIDICELLCYQEHNCVSFNFKKDPDSGTVMHECELNNSTHLEDDSELRDDKSYFYRGAKNACGRKPCTHGICQSGFSSKGYRCVCPAGFTGLHCETDIDECSASVCHVNANCQNNDGSYVCACTAGYTGDGKSCTDINECSASPSVCPVNANCQNNEGSYGCSCKPGYFGDGETKCTDKDECIGNNHNCDPNSTCQNTEGSYKCICNEGYTADGHTCQDIDECQGSHDCYPSHAFCTNTAGSYNCSCNPGYVGDGKTSCVEAPECKNYRSLREANRKITYGPGNKCDDNIGSGWFRFEGAAGTQMASSSPGIYKCETTATGYLKDEHPSVADGKVTRKVCFDAGNGCDHSTNVEVRNCGSYYVYHLDGTPDCVLRYCGSD